MATHSAPREVRHRTRPGLRNHQIAPADAGADAEARRPPEWSAHVPPPAGVAVTNSSAAGSGSSPNRTAVPPARHPAVFRGGMPDAAR